MATGARPNEVLALRWDADVDLSGAKAKITFAGTLVERWNKSAGGYQIERQDVTKTDKGFRTVTVSEWLTAILMEMRVMATNEKVFPNEKGSWLSYRNIASRFRDAVKGTPVSWMSPYSFRHGIATLLERTNGVDAAAKQLGHESPAITMRHYVEPADDAGDFTKALDVLAP